VSRSAAGRARQTAPIARIITVWLTSSATLLLLGALLPGVEIAGVGTALAVAAILGLLNGIVWPLVLRFALPLTVITLGLGVVLLNGAMVLLIAQIDSGFHVASLGSGVVVTIVLAVVNTAVTSALAIDDEGFWYRNVVRRYGRRVSPAQNPERGGIVFLEIDGLAHDVLVRAMRDGNAPTMASWVREATHRLARWETDWSSQTGACQAGLLHGNNDDIPAFRWWEKERNAPIVTNHPRDAAELERRHSDGHGLLFCDGSSRANIVSGDAPHSLLTMSTVLRRDRHGRIGQDYFAYFANPYNVTRTLVLGVAEIVRERWSAARQRRLDVRPRIHRGFSYALVRAWATIVQRDLQVYSVIADMYSARPVIYTTFLAYDEVAHHSGIERVDTLATLRLVDQQIGRIAAAARLAPRRYRLVVLSDHGQSQGETFLDRYGVTLEALVRDAIEVRVADGAESPSEALAFLGASITEASAGGTRSARALRRLAKPSALGGASRTTEHEQSGTQVPPEVVVMASGCLGLISFPRQPGRVSLEWIERHYPRLIPRLRGHPGIGFLLVRSDEHGAAVLGTSGVRFLSEDRSEGDDPLVGFGEHAARHVLRTDGFAHCPDIVLNSTYWAESEEVAAFEQLVGSHGGLGGTQSFPFLLHPVELELPADEHIVGAEAVHSHLRRWLVFVGQKEYAERRSPARATAVGAGGRGPLGASPARDGEAQAH
jgi:uncharacterized membrane protein YvlD (DUF360 family)